MSLAVIFLIFSLVVIIRPPESRWNDNENDIEADKVKHAEAELDQAQQGFDIKFYFE